MCRWDTECSIDIVIIYIMTFSRGSSTVLNDPGPLPKAWAYELSLAYSKGFFFGLKPGWETEFLLCSPTLQNCYGHCPHWCALDQWAAHVKVQTPYHSAWFRALQDIFPPSKGLKDGDLHVQWRRSPKTWVGYGFYGPLHACRFAVMDWHRVSKVFCAQDWQWANMHCLSGCSWAVVWHVFARHWHVLQNKSVS
jgi:hypothetical protein